MKTILLTWGTGFLGSHLMDRLCQDGYHIFLLIQETSHFDRIIHLQGQYTSVYFSDLSGLFESEKIDLVIHLATCYKKEHSNEDIEEMIYANITLPTKILELCAINNVKKFINTGTFFEYDLSVSEFTENTIEKAYNLYASLKLAFWQILQYYSSNHGMNIVTLRVFSPYWPKDNIKIIPILIRWILDNREVSLQDTSQVLHFTYVVDIINSYMATIDYLQDMNSSWYEVINIWSQESYSIEDIVSILENISSKKIQKKVATPYKLKEKTICNIQKARDVINWTPITSLEDWLRLTYNDYKNAVH